VGVESITNTLVYTYNGDGARVAMAVDGVETRWVQDVTGLPEVLMETSGGAETTYLYGHARLAQVEGASTEWFLGDALGSVRQVVDGGGEVVLARDYSPFGVVLSESGTRGSGYGFTGEQSDAYTQFVYLRARWMDPVAGTFISRDSWEGSIQQPSSLHQYLYASANPTNLTDPSGLIPQRPRSEADEARKHISSLRRYNVIVNEDFGWRLTPGYYPAWRYTGSQLLTCSEWIGGSWRSAWELEQVLRGVEAMAEEMGGESQFSRKVGRTVVTRKPSHSSGKTLAITSWNIEFYDLSFYELSGQRKGENDARNTVAHEFAHAWDIHHAFYYSLYMWKVTGGTWDNGVYAPGGQASMLKENPPANMREDWADAVGDHFFYRPGFLPMDATRITIVEQALETKNTYEFHESLKRRFPDRMN
jgi:RHS repeat-associated protein